MLHARWTSLALSLLFFPTLAAQEGKYTIKASKSEPPKELAEPIRKLLDTTAVQLLDPAGKVIGEVWFRKQVPADATPEQIKNGITYREVKQSEVMGAVKFEQEWRDYRKQKVKSGVYTFRLAYQPMDGDHTGSSEYQDFFVIVDAAKDTKTDLMDPKHLAEISARSIGTGHPAVFMLFPTKAPAAPALAAMPKNHWVVQAKSEVFVGGKSTGTSLGLGVTFVGAAD